MWPAIVLAIVGFGLLCVSSFLVPRLAYAIGAGTEEWQLAEEEGNDFTLDSLSLDIEGNVVLPSLLLMVLGIICCLIGEWWIGRRMAGAGTLGKASAVFGIWFTFALGGAVWFYNWARWTFQDNDMPGVFMIAWLLFAFLGGLLVSGYVCWNMLRKRPEAYRAGTENG